MIETLLVMAHLKLGFVLSPLTAKLCKTQSECYR